MADVIGLMGYAQVGKDTVAAMLAQHWYERMAFADPLRAMLYAINPIVCQRIPYGEIRVAELVDEHGWDFVKVNYPEVRALLQRLGTEAGREILGPDIWVHAALDKLDPAKRYVFTDVRFPNEFEAIADIGTLWRIERPGCGPVNDHPSETALDGYSVDHTIVNRGTLDQLRHSVRKALGYDPEAL